MCTHCEKTENILANVTPEVEQLLEALVAGAAGKLQEKLGEVLPGGLSRAMNDVLAGGALASLAEAFLKGLPKDRQELATRIAVRVIATSDKLKEEHARCG